MKYLVNSFVPTMVNMPAYIEFREISQEEFCENAKEAVSIINNKVAADIINQLCGTNIRVNRGQIIAQAGDIIYIIILTRIEEFLGKYELQQLILQKFIRFAKARVISSIAIDDTIAVLRRLKQINDEISLDYLISELEGEQQ